MVLSKPWSEINEATLSEMTKMVPNTDFNILLKSIGLPNASLVKTKDIETYGERKLGAFLLKHLLVQRGGTGMEFRFEKQDLSLQQPSLKKIYANVLDAETAFFYPTETQQHAYRVDASSFSSSANNNWIRWTHTISVKLWFFSY